MHAHGRMTLNIFILIHVRLFAAELLNNQPAPSAVSLVTMCARSRFIHSLYLNLPRAWNSFGFE